MDREDLRNQIRMQLPPEVSDVTDANLNLLLDAGVEEVSVWAHWPFLQKSGTLSATADTRTIALPADFARAISLVDDDHDDTIPYLSSDKFFHFVGNDTGNTGTEFDYWTIFGTNVMLSPIPSTNDSARFTLYYLKTPTLLTTDGTEPEWPTAFHMLLVEYGKWKLYEREALVEQGQMAYQRYLGYLADMQAYYNARIMESPSIYGGGRRPRWRHNIPWWPFNTDGN